MENAAGDVELGRIGDVRVVGTVDRERQESRCPLPAAEPDIDFRSAVSATRLKFQLPLLFVPYQRIPEPVLPTPVAGLYVSAKRMCSEFPVPASATRLFGPQVLSHGTEIDSTCCHVLPIAGVVLHNRLIGIRGTDPRRFEEEYVGRAVAGEDELRRTAMPSGPDRGYRNRFA